MKQLSSQFVRLPFRNKKTGDVVNIANCIHVRPIQLWEICFPKEYKDEILTTIFPNGDPNPDNKKFLKIFKWVKKFLPKTIVNIGDWDKSKKFFPYPYDMECVGLGMKEDITMNFERPKEQMESLGLDPNEEWEYEGL